MQYVYVHDVIVNARIYFSHRSGIVWFICVHGTHSECYCILPADSHMEGMNLVFAMWLCENEP